MSPPSRCSNCSIEFDFTKRKSIFQELSIITENTQGLSIESTVKVDTALSTIYKLSYLKDLACIKDNNPPLLLLPGNIDEKEEFGICIKCQTVLTVLVKTYNKFNQLRSLDSSLSNRIKNLNHLIRCIPAIINNFQDKISATTANNNTQHYEVKTELNSDEDDSNYLDDDHVYHLMDYENNRNEPNVHVSQFNNVNSNGEEKSRKISFDRVPTVKLYRLRQEEIQTAIGQHRELPQQQQPKDIKREFDSDDEDVICPWKDDDDDSDFVLSDEELAPRIPHVIKSRRKNPGRGKKMKTKKDGLSPPPPKRKRGRPPKEKSDTKELTTPRDPILLLGNTCPQCEKQIDIPVNLVHHLITHAAVPQPTKKKMCPCPVPTCPKRYATRTVLLCHLKEHAQVEKQTWAHLVSYKFGAIKLLNGVCPLCQKSFNVPWNLSTHLLTHVEHPSSDDDKIMCCPVPDCAASFTRKCNLALHLREHAQAEVRCCPLPHCKKTFLTDHRKREHFRSHWEDGQYICVKCDLIFESMMLLSNHRSRDHPDENVINSCPGCPNAVFQTEKDLNKHMLEKHHGERLFVCEICATACTLKRNLAKHSRVHSDKLLRCDLCKTSQFTSQKRLDRHRDLCQGVRIFACSICPKQYKNKFHCLLHERIHKGEAEPLKCSFEGCDKTFFRRGQFKSHVKVHTCERLFICDQCGMGFKFAKGLEAHQVVHTKEKTFLCTTCDKKFLRWEGLRKHLRTHSDVKPYPCEECGKQFKYTESLRLHLRTHHQEKNSSDHL